MSNQKLYFLKFMLSNDDSHQNHYKMKRKELVGLPSSRSPANLKSRAA